MNGKSTWGWVAGILVVLVIIAGLMWWDKKDQDSAVESTMQTATSSQEQVTEIPVAREDRTADSISGIIASIPEASTFNAMFVSMGVAASLSPTGKYTVFVPTNGSFTQLTPGLLSSITVTQKKRLVQYHVVSGRKLDIDDVSAGNITALSKDPLNFYVTNVITGGQKVQVNSAFAIKSYPAKNGIVYLINAVLIPPEKRAY